MVKEFLVECVDEIVALLFSVAFIATTSYLAITNQVEALGEFAKTVGPFLSAIIAFYFGKRAGQE